MTRARVVALVVAVLAITNAACSEQPPPGVDATFAEEVRDYLEHAEAAGASDEQIAILEDARRNGEIPFDVYSEAIDRALRCLRDAGFEIDDWGVNDEEGFPRRSYGIPLAVEADPAEMRELWPGTGVEEHRCFAEHSSWVQFAYDAQPSSIEARESRFEPYRDAVVECMVEQGVEVEPNLSREELMRAMADAWEDGITDVNCFREAGYAG